MVNGHLTPSQLTPPVPFTLVFPPDLARFLPPSAGRAVAAFASTAQDHFLFLQLEAPRVQVRALLLTKDLHLARIFRESSFFAFSRPPPPAWVQGMGLQLLPTCPVTVAASAARDLATAVRVRVRDPATPGRQVVKGDYACLQLELAQGGAGCLFLPLARAGELRRLLALPPPLLAARRPGALLLGAGALVVAEMNTLAELPLPLLRQEMFMVTSTLRDSLIPGQLEVKVQGGQGVHGGQEVQEVQGRQEILPSPIMIQ